MPITLSQNSQSLAPNAQITVEASVGRQVAQDGPRPPVWGNFINCAVYDSFQSLYKTIPTDVYDARANAEVKFWSNQTAYIEFVTELIHALFGENGWIQINNVNDANNFFAVRTAYYGSNYYARIVIDHAIVHTFNINLNEILRVRFTGYNVIFEWKSAGVWRTVYTHNQVPSACEYLMSAGPVHRASRVWYPKIFLGAFAGEPQSNCWTWTHSPQLTMTGSGAQRVFDMPMILGAYQICASVAGVSPACIDLTVTPLAISNAQCNQIVTAGATLEIQHNGGETAILVVTGGIVLDQHHWQLPVTPGEYECRVKIPARNGNPEQLSVPCRVCVAPELTVSFDYEGQTYTLRHGESFDDLYPGAAIQLAASCAAINCPNIIVGTPQPLYQCAEFPNNIDEITGAVVMPGNARDECFGFAEMLIEAQCAGQGIWFTLRTQPVYPTPDVCGPNALKWSKAEPDFREIENEFRGGSSESHVPSRTPIFVWENIDYRGLLLDAATAKGCLGVVVDAARGTANGCDVGLATAERIDAFYQFVNGRFGRFFYRDPNTGLLWKGMKFKEKLKFTHEGNFYTQQARRVSLIWRPVRCSLPPVESACGQDY